MGPERRGYQHKGQTAERRANPVGTEGRQVYPRTYSACGCHHLSPSPTACHPKSSHPIPTWSKQVSERHPPRKALNLSDLYEAGGHPVPVQSRIWEVMVAAVGIRSQKGTKGPEVRPFAFPQRLLPLSPAHLMQRLSASCLQRPLSPCKYINK